MSGIKESSFSLEQEQKAAQEALGDIKQTSNITTGIREKVEDILSSLPKGVKETFAGEIGTAKQWLRQLEQKVSDLKPEMGSRALRSIADTHRGLMSKGYVVLDNVVDVAENKQKTEARTLLKNNLSLSADLDGQRELLDKWCPDKYDDLKEQLDSFPAEINRGEFPAVTDGLEKTSQGLNRYGNEASDLEKQDHERRYVLNALEEVCSEMGFKSIGEAVLEDNTSPESDLLYEVNTYTAGMMEFRFSLEGISVHSPITSENDVCHSDFDRISTKLRNFGVNTRFEQVDGHGGDPHLLQRGELDLPDDGIELEIEQ